MLIIKIWTAYILDLIFGDPQNIIHPVQIIGKLISFGEKILLKEKYKFIAGIILNLTVLSVTYGVNYMIFRFSKNSGIFASVQNIERRKY